VSQKILIIDDSQPIHELLKVRLRDEGVQLHSAYDGESGLTAAKAVLPDLILLDVDMPGTDGFQVCRNLKAHPDTVSIPVIFLSGASSTDEKIRGLDLGAVDYITKPFEPAELCARVRASLRTRYLLDLLSRRAMLDGLTGLWNRAYLDQRLAAEICLSRRTGQPLACVVLDVDHFKLINDRFGHPVGDQVLQSISQLLADACRAEDVICRYGGDEFAIIAPNATGPQASELADRLRQVIASNELTTRATRVRVTCSFGVAELLSTADSLVERADDALYRAKQQGRDCVELADR
jgi:diguanylate cyclase (GGDEF)-like protein